LLTLAISSEATEIPTLNSLELRRVRLQVELAELLRREIWSPQFIRAVDQTNIGVISAAARLW
jgi:hypothetical protein